LQGEDDLNGTGNGQNNIITGNDGNNILNGAWGSDLLIGGAGNDTFMDDQGLDEMRGGLGDDVYYIDNTKDKAVENKDEGYDLVYTSVDYQLRHSSQFTEDLVLQGTDDIDGTGNGQVNVIKGNDGDNVLNGAYGDDILIGGAGDDVFMDDQGADTMTGGLGADRFSIVMYEANKVDTITDFSQAEGDILDIAAILSGYDALSDALADFVEIVDNGADTTIRVDVDGGANQFVDVANLQGTVLSDDLNTLVQNGTLIV